MIKINIKINIITFSLQYLCQCNVFKLGHEIKIMSRTQEVLLPWFFFLIHGYQNKI